MLAERSIHSSEAFFHSEPQLDLLEPAGMMPNDPIGGLPLLLSAIMPRRNGSSSAPVNPRSPSKSEMRDPSSPAPMKAFSGLSKNTRVFVPTWCVRFLPKVPLRVFGSYGVPILESINSRELFK